MRTLILSLFVTLAASGPRTVIVPSHVAWTYTGIRVKAGEAVKFDATGEIRLSFNRDDIAHPDGSPGKWLNDKTPVPTAPRGALIGRINSGQPFAIGGLSVTVRMPSGGILFLGVNDDHAEDNTGNYVVKVSQSTI